METTAEEATCTGDVGSPLLVLPIDMWGSTLAAFVADRIRRGYMSADAWRGVAKAVRPQPAEVRLALMHIPAPTTQTPLTVDAEQPLRVSAIAFGEAVHFCNTHHQHLPAPIGHKASFGCFVGERLVAVAIVGRPVARMLDDGETLEITRIATQRTKNAVSMLIGAVRRYAKSIGAARIVTYTLESESGHSLRAAGMVVDQQSSGGGSWSREGRERLAPHEGGKKLRWVTWLKKPRVDAAEAVAHSA